MKVLITGAGGYLGSYLVKQLVKTGEDEIRALVRPGGDISRLENQKEKIFFGDLLDTNSIDEMLDGIDCVYHLAAATSGSHFEMMMNTVVATENLLNALKGRDIKKFILVSSFSVYQMTALKVGDVLDESCPVESNPKARDPYTIAKSRQEKLTQKICFENNIPLTIIRPGKIYGPGDNPIPPQLGLGIPGICFLYIGGRHIIPLTHVSNCADAIYLAGVTDGIGGQVFNIVDDDLPTQKDFLKLYTRVLGKISRRIWVPYSVFYLMAVCFEIASKKTKGNIPPVITRYKAENLWKKLKYDNTKAKTYLKWKPRISTEEGLKEMFEWVAENG